MITDDKIIFDIVKKEMDKDDPCLFLNNGAPNNEYDRESHLIVDAIIARRIKSPDVLSKYIAKIMSKELGEKRNAGGWDALSEKIIFDIASL